VDPIIGLPSTSHGWIAQHPDDMSGETFLDFPMPRHRLGHAGGGIAVPVVLATMPHQNATEPLDCFD
jgi:hypothetical protein